jgi:hypothetical protein
MKRTACLVALLVMAVVVQQAGAGLTVHYQFIGKGNWSIDAVGSNNTPVGDISAVVPVGSTVERAFLYSTMTWGYTGPSTVSFDGTLIGPADFASLGSTGGLTAYRADVTAQVAAKIGGGSATPFTFSIRSETSNSDVDGEGLVIVYSNPAEKERTIAVMDGFSAMAGDNAYFNFADPLVDPTDPDFEALMSLGIGYSAQGGSQYSIVDVNGQRMSTSAGGQDDGGHYNGGLITFGGIGDSPDLPADPYATPGGDTRYDDELYDVKSFLTAGDTVFHVYTQNPSYDDNIFFLGLNVTAIGEVDEDEDDDVIPEPTTMALLGLGLLGVVRRRRRK